MVRRALGKAGISAKTAAGDMGISESQLGDQLNGREKYHLSFWRMHGLPREFWIELVDLIIAFHDLEPRGVSSQDLEYIRIGKLECEKQALIARAVSR
jgi:hypothetical protein